MVQATAAIGDFMLILIGSALWAGAGIAGLSLVALTCVGGAAFMARRWWRTR